MAKRGKATPVAVDEATLDGESLYRAVFQNMREGVALCRMLFENGKPQDWVYLRVNSAFEELTGLKNITGKKVSDAIPGIREASPELFDIYGRVAATGKPERFETFVKGLESWFSISAYCPAPGHFVAVFTITTEHKKTDEALRLFRALIDRSQDGVEVVDLETGRFLDVNEKGCLAAGYSREEFLALGVPDLDPTVDGSTFPKLQSELRRSGALTWEGLRRRKDGSLFPVEVSIGHVRLDRAYAVAVVRDISDRKRAEAQLHLQGAALNAAANAIAITDRMGTIVWVNPAFTALTGYGAEEAIGENPRELLKSGTHTQEFYQDLWETVLAGKVWRGEMVNRRKDGSRYPEEQTITPVKDARGEITHFIAIKRDLTEEKQLRAQYVQSQKMESVGLLAGGIAHDFNNLLGAITVFGELAGADLPEGDRRRADLDSIQEAVQRATTLTRQLLTFSRQQVQRPKVLDPNTVVGDLLKILGRLIGEDIELITNLDLGAGLVRADESQLEQVLMNLAVNARDAMPAGGQLIVMTSHVHLDEAETRNKGLDQPGNFMALTVTDTGSGIPADVLPRIFEPFFTTKGARGTGLGLATVYGIVKQSGGYVGVTSEVGKGSTFTIYLPSVPGLTSEPSAAASEEPAAGGNETILVVEDDPAVRLAVSSVLSRLGYTVLVARTAEDALVKATTHEGPIDLVVSDVVMPGMDGPTLIEELGSVRREMKALLTSGYAEDAIGQHRVTESGVSFLEKPFTAARLAQRVREVLDARAGPEPE